MKAHEPKAAVRVGGRPMAARVADAMRGAGISRIIAVVGHRADDVRAAMGESVEYVVQDQQLGSGHAARCSRVALASYQGPVVIAYADLPLLPTGEVARLLDRHLDVRPAATTLTAVFPEPGTLGRILRASDGSLEAIVEARDATQEQLAINEINVGVYCFEAPLVFDVLAEIKDNNAQRQLYLTDTIAIMVCRGERVEALTMESPYSGMGVDTQEDLARAQNFSAMSDAL
jgi:bifunctional UDP-N-acetylglucosamine pyrophosphorylase/glucosamine-1-phosphate N-acetyltransferase